MSREYTLGPVTEAEKAKAELATLKATVIEAFKLAGDDKAGCIRVVKRLKELVR